MPKKVMKAATSKDGHKFTPRGAKKSYVKVPRTKPKRPQYKTHGRGSIREWQDGTGDVRVGSTVVKMMKGEIDPADWTDEELMRGAPKNVKRVPQLVPLRVHLELVKRMKSKVIHRFATELQRVADVHLGIIHDKETPANVKLKAIDMLYDRLLGKPTEHMVLDVDAKWTRTVQIAVVNNEEQLGDVEEGEVLDDRLTDEDLEEAASG